MSHVETDNFTSEALAAEATLRGSHDVVRMLADVDPSIVVEVLESLNQSP